jgi:CRISPR-associated protein Csb1
VNVEEFYADLVDAVGLGGRRAVIRMTTTYQPAGGEGSKVFPPTLPPQNGQTYVLEERVVGTEPRSDVLLDSTPSQANRAEEALLRARRSGLVSLPLLELRHTGVVPVVLTSLEFPHRYADAYLRDSQLDGVPFEKTDLGGSFRAASPRDATALYTHDPGSLVFGDLDQPQQGPAGQVPAGVRQRDRRMDPRIGHRNAGRMGPLNLVGAARRLG